MVSDKINHNKAHMEKVLEKLHNAKRDEIVIKDRDDETGKKPETFFLEVGIDYSEAINIIKNLSYEDYQYTQLDRMKSYVFMYVFNKDVNSKIAYIKIGFVKEKTIVISFHQKMYE